VRPTVALNLILLASLSVSAPQAKAGPFTFNFQTNSQRDDSMNDGLSGDYWDVSGGYGFGGNSVGSVIEAWPCGTPGTCNGWSAEILFHYTPKVAGPISVSFVDILFDANNTGLSAPSAGPGNCSVSSGGTLSGGQADIFCNFSNGALDHASSFFDVFVDLGCGSAGTDCASYSGNTSTAVLKVGPLAPAGVPEPESIALVLLGFGALSAAYLRRQKKGQA